MQAPIPEHPPLCARCRYDLTGLSPIGRCPECGNEYDMFTKRGLSGLSSQQARMDRWLGRMRTLLLLAAAVACVALGGLLTLFGSMRPLFVGCVFAATFALAALTSWLYENHD